MLLFFAATESEGHREAALRAGVKNSLQSFYSLGCGKQPPSNKEFENYLLDSGGFSARKHGLDINVKDYARYLNNYNVEIAFNLDVRDNNVSLRNQKYLEENTNTYIIPVFHPTEWMSREWDGLLDYYIEFYPYISCGGIAGREGKQKENTPRLFNYVFSRTKDQTKVHGLGVTTEEYLKRYPFFTVDSTSWMAPALFASSKIHSEAYMKANAKSRHFSFNTQEDIPWWINLQNKTTKLWKNRGIEWGPFDYDELMKKRAKKIPSFEEWRKR